MTSETYTEYGIRREDGDVDNWHESRDLDAMREYIKDSIEGGAGSGHIVSRDVTITRTEWRTA